MDAEAHTMATDLLPPDTYLRLHPAVTEQNKNHREDKNTLTFKGAAPSQDEQMCSVTSAGALRILVS